jgi:hypothetical protein
MCRSEAEGGRRCPGRKGMRSSTAAGSTGGSASPGPSGRIQRSRAAVLQAAQKQMGDLLDAAVNAAPVDSAATLVSAADADVADQVADAIMATLEAHGCPRGSWQSHLLCGALAAVAKAMKAREDLARTAVAKGVMAALVAGGMPRSAAGLAGRAATDTLMKLTPVRHWEDVRRAVQLLAVSVCRTRRIIPKLSSTACSRSPPSCCRLRFRRSWRSHCRAIVHCRAG